MDLTSIIGLLGAVLVVIVTYIIEGGNPFTLLSHPQAILITAGGALIATVFGTPLKDVMTLPRIIIATFTEGARLNFLGMIELIGVMADKARREGLLALEEETRNITDGFLMKGIMMVVDGVDPHQIQEILRTSIEQMEKRHKKGYGFFEQAGGYAPTFGIIGTVMGLMGVLQDLTDPNATARKIAAAFLATWWGLASANLLFMPISAKLKAKSQAEVAYRHMLMEGVLAIQAGENPRVIRDKLSNFVPPSMVEGRGEGV